MPDQKLKEKRHWMKVNLLGRIIGLMFLVAGMSAAIDGFLLRRNPNEFGTESMGQTLTGSFMWDLFGVSAFTLVIGVLFMVARPYRPDLYEPDATKLDAQRRSWWTGEPTK